MDAAAKVAAMQRWGDEMQSEASRLSEYVQESLIRPPYEVQQALVAVRDLVEQWTALRR